MTSRWHVSPSSGNLRTEVEGHFYEIVRSGSHRWTVFEIGHIPNKPEEGLYGKEVAVEGKTAREAKRLFEVLFCGK